MEAHPFYKTVVSSDYGKTNIDAVWYDVFVLCCKTTKALSIITTHDSKQNWKYSERKHYFVDDMAASLLPDISLEHYERTNFGTCWLMWCTTLDAAGSARRASNNHSLSGICSKPFSIVIWLHLSSKNRAYISYINNGSPISW